MSPPVFISYVRSTNLDHAALLHRELGDGVSFLDTVGIEYGKPFPDPIVEALLGSRVVVLFVDGEYFTRWYCLWELRTALEPFLALGPGAPAAARSAALGPLVIAIPETGKVDLTPLPPGLRQSNWPRASETARLVALVKERLVEEFPSLGERIDAAGGSHESTRARLLNESSLPEAQNLGAVKRLYPVAWQPSLRESFVGRADELWLLDYMLSTMRREVTGAALSGSLVAGGGFGKTCLAREYVYRLGPRNHPDGIFWVDAGSEQALLELQFHGILQKLRPDAPPLTSFRESGRSVAEALGQALQEVAGRERILYVVDNVPEGGPQDIRAWCPVPGMVALLLTSRARLDLRNAGVGRIPVAPLKPADAVELLTEGVQRQVLDDASWRIVTAWVGELPLALVLLNRALKFVAVMPDELLEKARSAGPVRELDLQRAALDEAISRDELPGITQALEISYVHLPDSSRGAARLLAWLAPNPIPPEVLRALEPDVSPANRAVLVDRSFLTQADASMVGGVQFMSVQMHGVLADFLQGQSTDPARELRRVCAAVLEAMPTESLYDPGQWPKLNACIPLADQVLRKLKDFGQPAEEQEVLLALSLGVLLSRQSFAVRAQEVLEAILPRALASLGGDHPDVISVENSLGQALHARGETSKALELQVRLAEKIRRNPNAADSPLSLAVFNNLAIFQKGVGNYHDALDIQEQLVELHRGVFGPRQRQTLTAMDNRVVTLLTLGDLSRGVALGEEVVALFRAEFGADDPSTLTALSNLASGYQKLGEWERSAVLVEEVVESRRKLLGKMHIDTLLAESNLAVLRHAQGRFGEARTLQEQTLARRRQALGDAHPHTLQGAVQLARTLAELKLPELAQQLIDENLAAARARYGDAHPTTWFVERESAGVLKALGDTDGAQHLLERMLATFNRELGSDHPETLSGMSRLGNLLARAGKMERSRELLERVLVLRRQLHGGADSRTAEAARDLASTLVLLGDWPAAERAWTECWEGTRLSSGETHHTALFARRNLAVALYVQRKLDAAQAHFEAIREEYRRIRGDADPQTRETTRYLCMVLNAQKEFAVSRRLLEELLALVRDEAEPQRSEELDIMEALANACGGQGDFTAARTYLELVVSVRRQRTGDDDPKTGQLMEFLRNARFHSGEFDGAMEIALDLVDVSKRRYGAEAPETLGEMERLAVIHERRKDLSSARELMEQVVAEWRRTQGDSAPKALNTMSRLANLRHQVGDISGALELQERVLEVHRNQSGADAEETLKAISQLAFFLFRQDRYAEARQQLEGLLHVLQRKRGEDAEDTLRVMENLAYMYQKEGDTQRSEAMNKKVNELRSSGSGSH